MSLATILATLDGGPGSEAALSAALYFGRRHQARVDLLHVEIDVAGTVPVVGEGMSGAALEQIMQSLQEEAARRRETARALYEQHCVSAGLPVVEPVSAPEPGRFVVSFQHVVGREIDEIVRRGRLHDLIVMARSGEGTAQGGEDLSPAFDAALFDSGRPVCLVPAKPVADVCKSVAVAWNGSRESVRAVAMTLPLLSRADKVFVLTARDGSRSAEPSDLARYLAAHGITARTWAFTPGVGPIGEALLLEAAEMGADIMV
ncbi:MAG: universal stress protein, partial [Alphaproteobacteria bacterium]